MLLFVYLILKGIPVVNVNGKDLDGKIIIEREINLSSRIEKLMLQMQHLMNQHFFQYF